MNPYSHYSVRTSLSILKQMNPIPHRYTLAHLRLPVPLRLPIYNCVYKCRCPKNDILYVYLTFHDFYFLFKIIGRWPAFSFMRIRPHISIRFFGCLLSQRTTNIRKTLYNNNSLALVRERTIPTERPSFVGEVNANVYGQWVSRDQRSESHSRNLGFLDRSCNSFFKVAPQLYA
jgi:hypothetical protein